MEKVKYVRLQTRLYVKGIGDLGDVFPSENKTFQNLELTREDSGDLMMSFLYKGEPEVIIVPYTNVIMYHIDLPKKSLKIVK